MERIFIKVKIFFLKQIVFPVLQIIAKYKAEKKISKKITEAEKTSILNEKVKEMSNNINTKQIRIAENINLSPKNYGEYLQQTGKQIWNKKK